MNAIHQSMDESDESGANSFEGFFRSPALAAESPLAWTLSQRQPMLEAVRGIFSGSAAWVQLRLWCFMELASTPKARLEREDLHQLFHSLQPHALESVLKRLRDTGLLSWSATEQAYALTDVAKQVHAFLAPLAHTATEDDELASLLAHVAGAQALGIVDASQLQHLRAQLARLHDEFADAIASGSESRLREAQPRFERALHLVERAGQALTALIRSDTEDSRLEQEARALGHGQALLLAMASQFNRAMQQADRQRVTLGSTGVTSTDVREWLRDQHDLHALMAGALSVATQPIFVSQQDLLDVAEAEFERDRHDPARNSDLPPANLASSGKLEVPSMPQELFALIDKLSAWHDKLPQDEGEAFEGEAATSHGHLLQDAVLGGRFAQAAYRMQLLPLLGDAQAQGLKGQTGELARSGWWAEFSAEQTAVDDSEVKTISKGQLLPTAKTTHAADITAAAAKNKQDRQA